MTAAISIALLISLLAGMATSIGGLLAFVIKKDNLALLALGLGLSAGVMLYVSFMEMMPQARLSLAVLYGQTMAAWGSTGLFFFVFAWRG